MEFTQPYRPSNKEKCDTPAPKRQNKTDPQISKRTRRNRSDNIELKIFFCLLDSEKHVLL